MRTQQLFHLQKALVLHSGGDGGEAGGGGVDQVLSGAVAEDRCHVFRSVRCLCVQTEGPS